MKPAANRFFIRGGFSSSLYNYIEQINDADIEDSLYEDNLISRGLIVNQNKSKRDHQRFRCGLSA